MTQMNLNKQTINNLKNQCLALINEAENQTELNQIKIDWLGRQGKVNQLLKQLKKLSPQKKQLFGPLINELKQSIILALKQTSLSTSYPIPNIPDSVLTEPDKPSIGHLHPLTLITQEITQLFEHFGFSLFSGPQIEWDEYNFQKLRLNPDHPSRDTQETYYLTDKTLLRTHTSPAQIRYMENHQPPLRIIVPGMVYRRDTIDATHLPAFYQVEGLMVDDHTTLTDLLGILSYTIKHLVGDLPIRFYGHNFPYTEPSIEVEVKRQGKWMEILGAGMVHPEVLKNCGIDPQKYTGWAFGMGLDRLAMLRYNIADIRSLFEPDLRFLNRTGI